MNTNIIAGLVIGVAIIGGSAFYFFGNKKSASNSEGTSPTENTQAAGSFTGSFADLAKRGGEWKCTVDNTSETGVGQVVSSGVVYVSGDKVRAEYNVTVPSLGSMKGYMVSDGEYIYSWSSMLPQGVKTKASVVTQGSGSVSGQVVDANYAYSYDCQPSSPDASLFIAPANITFMSV